MILYGDQLQLMILVCPSLAHLWARILMLQNSCLLLAKLLEAQECTLINGRQTVLETAS